MKISTLLLLFISHLSFSSTSNSDWRNTTFNEHLAVCQAILKKYQKEKSLSVDWEKETFILRSIDSETVIQITDRLKYEWQSNGKNFARYVFEEPSNKAIVSYSVGGTDTSYFEKYQIEFKIRPKGPRGDFYDSMRRMLEIAKIGQNELGRISGDMSFAMLEREIEVDKSNSYKKVKGYAKTMNALLTEIDSNYPNINLNKTIGEKLFNVTYEIPSFEFPYTKTILEQNESTGLIRVKVHRTGGEPHFTGSLNYYFELIELAVTKGDFYFTRTEDENPLLEGYYPVKKHSTGEIIAYYNVKLDETGFEVIDYRTKNIAEQFATVLKTFMASNDLKTFNRDLLLPGSSIYDSGIANKSKVISQTYGIDGFMMLETITGSNQKHFKSYLPTGINMERGFKRDVRVESGHDRYVYLFNVNEKLVYMWIDVDHEGDTPIMTVALFKGDDELYTQLIEDSELADQLRNEEAILQSNMLKMEKELPFAGTVMNTKQYFNDSGYTILGEKEFKETPNDKNLYFRYAHEDLYGYTEVSVFIVFDRDDYFWGEPNLYMKLRYSGNEVTQSTSAMNKQYPFESDLTIARYYKGAVFTKNDLEFISVYIDNFTKGTYYIVAK
ncbi:MAG: hypothetical protein GQ574_27575 [Crocinitomix sp.]|nr:hypothetical protein [Crocinitomix sp.]